MMKYGGESIAEEIVEYFSKIESDRGTWESHWTEIAERVLPAHSPLFQDRGRRSPGEKRTEHLFDSTAAVALKRFGAILDSLLTPRNQTWHRLVPSDPYLSKDRQTRLWFEEVNRLLFKHRYAPMANFSSQNQQNYLSLGAYGTGCVFTDQLVGAPGLRYRNIHLGEIYFCENHQGLVDRAYRNFDLTARQLMKHPTWKDKLPDSVKGKAEANGEQCFEVIHCVMERQDLDPARKDYRGKKYASYYVLRDGMVLLEEGGYDSFPYAISRYEQLSGEVYGRSPAMDVLPAIKTLNEQKKTMLKQGHRAVDPVLLAHDDGVIDGFSLKPGALNLGAVSAEGRALVQALPVGNISVGKEMMDDERSIINDSFLVSIFQILVENPQMTATEVMERTREKGILLAPTIGRQQSEYLGPLIDRELDVLAIQGILPPMPQALLQAKGEYRTEYDSPISRAQRAEEASGIMRTVEQALQVVNVTQNPEPLDFFNWDTIIPEMAEIAGVPERWMRAKDEVMQMRAGRQEAAQAQQAMNAAPGIAAVAKAGAAVKKAGG
jgi:hypothetical protein